ncbi:MAG: LysR family transcriptional regulator [Gammaproteobacteria bacterium]
MSIKQLQYVFALYRERHFGRAALACNVTQSTLSLQISKLEGYLDTKLFNRNSRNVEPTQATLDILPMIENIIDSYAQIRKSARHAVTAKHAVAKHGVIEQVNAITTKT